MERNTENPNLIRIDRSAIARTQQHLYRNTCTNEVLPQIIHNTPPSYIQQATIPITENLVLAYYYFIETLLKNSSLKLIATSNKIPQIITKIDSILIRVQSYPYMAEKLISIKNLLMCSRCGINDFSLIFECDDKLCRRCFENLIGAKLIPPNKEEEPLKCPVCSKALCDNEYSYYFQDWEERVKLSEQRQRTKTAGLIECKTCLRSLKASCFRLCRCQCFQCQLSENSLGYCQFDSNTFSSTIYCDSCKKQVENPYHKPFYILCVGHIHCSDCTIACFADFKCRVCKNALEYSSMVYLFFEENRRLNA